MIIKRDCIYTPKGENRPLHIYLPDDYHETDERYPVMYFFDGHNLFQDEDATYGKSWGLKEFLKQWEKPMIVVGMECAHKGNERLSEYTPYPVSLWEGAYDEFLGEETFQWIIEEIKPMIDQEFRTYPFRECTGIAGSSMGGLMALYGAVHHNQWFSKAGCVSSAIGFCIDDLMKDMKDHPVDPDTRVYLSWGSKEAFGRKTHLWNQMAADQIEHCHAKVRMECQIDGEHCEADWEKLVPGFMNFLWLED